MKTAIYIEDGTIQLVLTPESEFEKNAMRQFTDKRLAAQLFRGSFYDCRGGWIRQTPVATNAYVTDYQANHEDQSLILRANPNEEAGRPIRAEEGEIELLRLRRAIRWALGEIGDFGANKPKDFRRKPYWWRKELRERAGQMGVVEE